MTLEGEIERNPDGVLDDEDRMRDVIADPNLTIKLLTSKEVDKMTVILDGEKVALVKPIIPPPCQVTIVQ